MPLHSHTHTRTHIWRLRGGEASLRLPGQDTRHKAIGKAAAAVAAARSCRSTSEHPRGCKKKPKKKTADGKQLKKKKNETLEIRRRSANCLKNCKAALSLPLPSTPYSLLRTTPYPLAIFSISHFHFALNGIWLSAQSGTRFFVLSLFYYYVRCLAGH